MWVKVEIDNKGEFCGDCTWKTCAWFSQGYICSLFEEPLTVESGKDFIARCSKCHMSEFKIKRGITK